MVYILRQISNANQIKPKSNQPSIIKTKKKKKKKEKKIKAPQNQTKPKLCRCTTLIKQLEG
jgi:hypothetical protein